MVSGSPTPPLAAQGSVKGSSFLGRSSSEAVTDRELMNMKEDLQPEIVEDVTKAPKHESMLGEKTITFGYTFFGM